MVFTIVNKKDWSSYKLGIICGILLQEYLKKCVKKVNILKTLNLKSLIQLKLFFDLQNLIFHLCPNVAWFLKNSFIWEDYTIWKNNIEWTRISRWLGRENEENVARTRKLGECGSDEKMMWLAFLPSLSRLACLEVARSHLNFFPLTYSLL